MLDEQSAHIMQTLRTLFWLEATTLIMWLCELQSEQTHNYFDVNRHIEKLGYSDG